MADVGAVAASLILTGEADASRLIHELDQASVEAIEAGTLDTRSLGMLISNGVGITTNFPRFDRAMKSALSLGGEQAWIAALQAYYNSSTNPKERSFPTGIPLEEITAEANFSLAGGRAVQFIDALPEGHCSEIAWRRLRSRWRSSVDAERLPLDLLDSSRERATKVNLRVHRVLDWCQQNPRNESVPTALLARASRNQLQPQSSAAIRKYIDEWIDSAIVGDRQAFENLLGKVGAAGDDLVPRAGVAAETHRGSAITTQ